MTTTAALDSFRTTLHDLITRFSAHYPQTHAMSEANTRNQFINPFFEALGWNLYDPTLPPHLMEVVVEEQADEMGRNKKVDYLFRLGGMDKFTCEAKKPAENLVHHALQAQNYVYRKKLYLGLLTNFEHLHLFIVGAQPNSKRPFNPFRVWSFSDYESSAQELWNLLARESIAGGSIERFVASLPKSTARASRGWVVRPDRRHDIDDDFLAFLDRARSDLAKRLVDNNPRFRWGDTGLNEATQRILDRILFIRICEDRDIDTHRALGRIIADWRTAGAQCGQFYASLVRLFRHIGPQFNGGLFGPHFSEDLKIDDDKLARFIEELSADDSSYQFSDIPVEILGSVYERFLTKIIHVSDGGTVTVKIKPELSKELGIVYTPRYIVRDIIEQTVGKLLSGKSPDGVAALKILDPACGSGSFLLRAFERVCEYYIQWYHDHPKYRNDRVCYLDMMNRVHLTTAFKRQIMLNNIFGVDIDPQAVEVTQLSLYLKILEGETRNSLAAQRSLFPQETFLPDLSRNIVCGNSLIGTDFSLVLEERHRVNAMDFKDRFPSIMNRGGFDVVVGNPPYIFTRETITPMQRAYFAEMYALSWEKQNTFMLFMERMLSITRPSGVGSFIVPNSWLTVESAKLLRQRYLTHLRRVLDLNYQVFHGVSLEPCIFIASGSKQTGSIELARIDKPVDLSSVNYRSVKRQTLQKHNRIVFHETEGESALIERILSVSKPLGEVFDVRTGLQAYEKGKGNPAQTARDVRDHVFDRKHCENDHSVRYLDGRDVKRYGTDWSGIWMQYGPWLSQPREIGIFTRPRLLLREITSPAPYCLNVAYVEKQFLNNKSILNVLDHDDDKVRLMALCGVLNSRLMSFYYKRQAVKSGRRIFPKVVIRDLASFPVPPALKETDCTALAETVEQMLEGRIALSRARTDSDRHAYESQCESLDRKIDAMVCDLYGLRGKKRTLVGEWSGR